MGDAPRDSTTAIPQGVQMRKRTSLLAKIAALQTTVEKQRVEIDFLTEVIDELQSPRPPGLRALYGPEKRKQ